MNFNEYQRQARTTALYPKNEVAGLAYVALGLNGEAGEVASKIKKIIRDGKGNKEAIAYEIGDVLWYCAVLASELGVELNDIMRKNLQKLQDRKEKGTLQGSGDRR